MAGEVVQREAKGPQKGSRRQKRRISIRIDMTPMVDIAFLLLIFYMVSTVFSMPQAMEINLPPPAVDDTVEIMEWNLLTLRIDSDGRYWWNLGRPRVGNLPTLLPPDPSRSDTIAYRLWPDTLRGLLVARNQANDRLSTLLLINRETSYARMVDVLDEIDLIERSWNKYLADQLGKMPENLTKDEKFSYRYAIGEWEPSDDKILDSAVALARRTGALPSVGKTSGH